MGAATLGGVSRLQQAYHNHYQDLFPFEAVASIIDCFPDQRKLDDWVVVRENFVTPQKYTKVTEYYAAYLRGENTGHVHSQPSMGESWHAS